MHLRGLRNKVYALATWRRLSGGSEKLQVDEMEPIEVLPALWGNEPRQDFCVHRVAAAAEKLYYCVYVVHGQGHIICQLS